MMKTQSSDILLDQSNDLFWMVDPALHLIYANSTYLDIIKKLSGEEIKLNDSVLIESFGEAYIEKWKSYYTKALHGESFEIEDNFFDPISEQIQYNQITLKSLTGEDGKIFAISCQARDFTQVVKDKFVNEQRFKALVQEGSDLIAIIDTAGIYNFVSPTSTSILGIKPEEFIGKNAFEFIHPEDAERIFTCLQKTATDKRVIIAPFRFQNHNKEWRWMESVLTNMLDNPAVKGIVVNSKDITDKIEREQLLFKSEQRFKALVQEGFGQMAILNAEGKYTYISPAARSMLGADPEEFIGTNGFEALHPDDVERTATAFKKIHTEKRVIIEPFRFLNHQKQWRWMETVLTNMFDNPAVNGIVANSRDITEEKRLKELNRQANRLAKIGSWEVDFENNKIFWSDEVHKLHETDSRYFVPTMESGIHFYREDFQQLVGLTIQKCAVTGEPFDFEAVLVTAKKREVWVRVIGNGEFVNGECKRIYGSFQDINEWKLSAEKLQHIFDEKDKILESIGDAFFTVDGTWKITYWNKQAEQILSKKRESIIGKYLWVEYADAIDSEFYTVYHRVLETGQPAYMEAYYETLKIWLDVSVYSSGDGLSIYLRDVTLRKTTEQQRNSLQSTLEKILNEIYICDAETFHFSYANTRALQNLGYTEEEIKTLTPLDIKPDFTATSFQELLAPLTNNEQEKIIFFTRLRRKNGSLYHVEVHLQFVKEENNKRFLAIVLDITDRKLAEENILLSNERFEKVTEATNDAVWDWDLEKQTIYRSKAFEKFFGEGSSTSFGLTDFWKNNFHPDEVAKNENSINEAIADPTCFRWELEYRVFNAVGKTLYVIDRGVIIRNNEGKAIRMVGAMTDVTEQKQMTVQLKELNQSLKQYTAELERSNEELEQFAYVASHDLQEPLRMIHSFLEQLNRRYGHQLDTKAAKYIHFATEGAKRMKQIILDLLAFSKAGKPTDGKEEVDMNEAVLEFKFLRGKLILEKKAAIISTPLPILFTHKAAVTQTLHCLLDNALKYAKEGVKPIIEVSAAETEKHWEFAIKDNGIGIESQFYEQIFIIFQRLHNKDEYSGTGIGLSIAKRHIEYLGGRIWLDSAAGEGTIFYFTIPKNKNE